MDIIKITTDMVFMLETDGSLSRNEQEHVLDQWNKVFPNNRLVMVKTGTLKILQKEAKSDQN